MTFFVGAFARIPSSGLADPGRSGEVSWGNEPDEIVVVPACGFAGEAHGVLALFAGCHGHRDVADRLHVLRSMSGADARLIVVEGDVEDPVQSVLDRPVLPDGRPEAVGAER
ncbi:hypothetical protein [Methylobacterium sp. ap11]|uniref:hypothetical protein n=1 Tax=Methylobacterium sp. ap11 TaxID=1761799 RepID=UPI001FCD86FB|nr:hypothetical protein [Methylobacterium sp. ap11]